jgi:uncharacterized membrane protein YedE/YeeE
MRATVPSWLAQCPWPVAGLLVGLIAVGLQWADNLPLGATGAAAGFLSWARRPWTAPSWRALFFIGIPLGALVYSQLTGQFTLSFATPGFDAALAAVPGARPFVLLVAGGLIGFGARWAGGCTSGHGICGVGRLQKGSLLATATFVGTAIVTATLVWSTLGRHS